MNKKKLLIIFPILLIILLLLFLKPAKKAAPPAGSIPLPSQKPFSNQPPATSTAENLTILGPKTVAFYKLELPDSSQLETFFSLLAQEFNFTTSPVKSNLNSAPHLLWLNGSAYLDVALTAGQFNFKPLQPDSAGKNIINRVQALDIAKNFFQKYRLLDSSSVNETIYLKSLNYELQATTESVNADVFRFYFYPEINALPIFSSNYEPSPVMIDITNKGDVFQVNYQLPALTIFQLLDKPQSLKSTNYAVKSAAQLAEEIKNNQAVVTSIQTNPNQYLSSLKVVKNVNYQLIKLGYQFDSVNNRLVPVFQLLGNGALEDGSTVNVTAYLPALAD